MDRFPYEEAVVEAGDIAGVNHGAQTRKSLIHIWVKAIRLSSVSKPLFPLLSTTYRPLETAEQRPRTPKTRFKQVILQVRFELDIPARQLNQKGF